MNQLKAEGSQELRPSVCYQMPVGLASMRVQAILKPRSVPLGPYAPERLFFGYEGV